MRSTKMGLWLVALLGIAACGEEVPVGLPGLLPGGGTQTTEYFLDAADFLAWDSVRTGYLRPAAADFVIAADQFGGELDAHGLFRFQDIPRTLTYQDTLGVTQTDSLPALTAGRLVFKVDTARTAGPGPIEVSLYQMAEAWDRNSANWLSRVDTGSVQLAWAEPGGTMGDLIDSAILVPGDSLLTFAVDSSTLALWRDSVVYNRGVMVRVETPGSRVELNSSLLHFKAHAAALPDTLIADSAGMRTSTFLLHPDPDPGTALAVGGTPTWRTYLQFKDRLDTLAVPCPGATPGCTIQLRDVVLNYAGIELRPVPPPAGFATLDTSYYESRTVLQVEGVPLIRLPLGVAFGDIVMVPPTDAADTEAVTRVPVTALFGTLAGADSVARKNAPRTMALLGFHEGDNFGIATFGSIASGPRAPRLRLVYSVMKEVQVQ